MRGDGAQRGRAGELREAEGFRSRDSELSKDYVVVECRVFFILTLLNDQPRAINAVNLAVEGMAGQLG
jgi:hypothetical protein